MIIVLAVVGNGGGDNDVKSNSEWYKNVNGDKICTMIFFPMNLNLKLSSSNSKFGIFLEKSLLCLPKQKKSTLEILKLQFEVKSQLEVPHLNTTFVFRSRNLLEAFC
jgi:hypothetical protein